MIMSEENQVTKAIESTPPSILDDIFKDRDAINPGDVEPTEEKKAEKTQTKKVLPKNEEEPKKVVSKPMDEDDEDELVETTELQAVKKELDKVKKALADSQKWGHTNSRKLKSAIKSAHGLLEQGVLTEEETYNLIHSLESEDYEVDADLLDTNNHPFAKYINVANEKFQDLKDIFEDDEHFDKKVEAFNQFLTDADQEECEELLEELEKLKNSPLKMAKFMFKAGEKHFETYRDYLESGGLKKFLAAKNNEIEKLTRKIDKLKNKLLQYEDYDKSNLRIDELSDSEAMQTESPKSALDQLFGERDRVVKRR